MDEWLMVGKVVAAQGLRGELRVVPRSDFPQRFTTPGPRWLRLKQMEPRPVDLVAGRQLPGKELFVVRLGGIDSREAAEALVGQELLVRGDDRPELAEGEFHLSDLVGLQVRLEADGRHIGTVVDLLSAGNDLLEVELNAESPGDGQGRRVLVPFVEAIVPTVNLSEGWLGLTPPPGLLDP